MPNVSVVIPAYNASRFVGEAIRSVLAQTYEDFEVIVVDDGSTDGTCDVVNGFHDERLRYTYQENQGPSAARNTGVQLSRGEYIAFLDADDLWSPPMLEACLAFLNDNPATDVVSVRSRHIGPDGEPLGVTLPMTEVGGPDLFEYLVLGGGIHTSSAVIRRDCLQAVGLWDESLHGNTDWDLWLRMAAAGFRFGFIDRDLDLCRRHSGNITLDYERMRSSRLAVLDKVFNWDNQVNDIAHLRNQAYANAFVRSCIRGLRNDLVKSATRDFLQAVEYHSDILTDVSFYYQVACISVPIGYAPNFQILDLDVGQRMVNQLIASINASPRLTASDARGARATAALALGMLYYTYTSDMASARKHFLSTVVRWPFAASTWIWLARALVGRETIGRLRHMLCPFCTEG